MDHNKTRTAVLQTKKRVKTKMQPPKRQVPLPQSDEEACRKGYEENVGMCLAAGAIYRRSILSNIHFVAANIAIILTLVGVCSVAVHGEDDLSLLFEAGFYASVILSLLGLLLSSCFIQERITNIYTALGRGIYEYATMDDETAEEIRDLRCKGKREKNFLKKMLLGISYNGFAGFTILLPAMAIYTGTFFEPQKSSGIVEGLPTSMWIPLKIDDEKIVLARILLTFFLCYSAWAAINMVAGLVALEICVGHTLLYEFKVLALTIKTFVKRAKWIHWQTCNAKGRMAEESLQKCLKTSLKECIIHHTVLLEIVADYVETYRVICLFFLTTNTVVICLSAISLCSDIPLQTKTIFTLFTIMELINSFVFCYYGQILLDAHELIQNAICECKWTEYSSLIGKHILILLTRLQKPLSQTAGGFTNVNLDTYSQIVNTSFSYFTLLQALS